MRTHAIPSRPHVQGCSAPIRLRHSAGELSDGAGLLLLRRLWDRLGLGERIDASTRTLGGRFRSSLLIEQWIVLLLYGGGVLEDLHLLRSRGLRRLFGWAAVADPTTMGRWLRRAGAPVADSLDTLLWQVVRARWAVAGVPKAVMLVLDSTVVLRYGQKQAGAERGYNPKKPGRPSHHPLLAFLAETGDCMGVRWRPGSAHTAAGACEWIGLLVERLRSAGVEEITLRMDKGFYSKEMVQTLEGLGVGYVLKLSAWKWVKSHLSTYRRSEKDERLWTASGTLHGARLLSVEQRRDVKKKEGELEIEAWEVEKTAHLLTNITGIHALSAWRRYNQGAVIEQRIEEMGQLSVGTTAVDDLGGNHLLWAMGALAYELLHFVRSTALSGSWRTAQPKRLRVWLLRLPAKLTRHARKEYVQLQRAEPMRALLLSALRRLGKDPPPLRA